MTAGREEALIEPCIECNGEGVREHRCREDCIWCKQLAPEKCYWDGARTPCEECGTGAAWARDNGFPETLFAIHERMARAALLVRGSR